MSLYGLGGVDDKNAEAADLLLEASDLFKGTDYAKAGDLFIKAWKLIKPKGSDVLWNAGLAYEQAAADQTATLSVRRVNAYKAKAVFTEWNGLKLSDPDEDVAERIAALNSFIAKVDKAMKQGQKVALGPSNNKKKAGVPMVLVVVGLVGLIGLMTMGKKGR